jgi:hypothetical protein
MVLCQKYRMASRLAFVVLIDFVVPSSLPPPFDFSIRQGHRPETKVDLQYLHLVSAAAVC